MFTVPSSVLRSYSVIGSAGHTQQANCHFTHKYPAVGFAVMFNPFLEHVQIQDVGRAAQKLEQN